MARKVIVVGGGASGIVAAITAARQGAKVTLLEQKNRIGKKILATGNGRCNIANRLVDRQHFHSSTKNLFDSIYRQFDLTETIAFFSEIGVEILELEDGKLYPLSLQAASVVNVMLDELDALKVQVVCDARVTSIDINDRVIATTASKKYYGDALILAAGGRSTPNLGSDGSGYKLSESIGLNRTDVYPSLVQLTSNYAYLKHLKGTKVMASIQLCFNGEKHRKEYGELLFTDYGISGPPVLQISREASIACNHCKKSSVHIECDLMPAMTEEALDTLLIKRIEHMPTKTLERFFIGMLPKQLIVPLIKDTNMTLTDQAASITKRQRQAIIQWLKSLDLTITGTNQWNQSQVTAGGVDCNDVDEATLSVKGKPNVYVCGELLDMDGDCGGFNLQWAWSSGYVAGLNAAKGK